MVRLKWLHLQDTHSWPLQEHRRTTGTGWNRRTHCLITGECSFGTCIPLKAFCPLECRNFNTKMLTEITRQVPAPHPLLHPAPHSDKACPIQWQSPGYLEYKAGTGQHRHRSHSCLLQQGAWAKGRAACQDFQHWNRGDAFTTQSVGAEFPWPPAGVYWMITREWGWLKNRQLKQQTQ